MTARNITDLDREILADIREAGEDDYAEQCVHPDRLVRLEQLGLIEWDRVNRLVRLREHP